MLRSFESFTSPLMSLASLTVVEVVEVLVVETAGLGSFLADSSIFLEDSLWGRGGGVREEQQEEQREGRGRWRNNYL